MKTHKKSLPTPKSRTFPKHRPSLHGLAPQNNPGKVRDRIILGIDPGTTRIGYGLIKKTGSKLELLDYGLIEPGRENSKFSILDRKLSGIIKKYKPDLAAVEKLYFAKNKKTAMAVAESRGIILFILNQHGLKIMEFSPNEIKLAVTGSGSSDKKTVAHYVSLTLKIGKISGPDDASDALAAAIRASFERGSPC